MEQYENWQNLSLQERQEILNQLQQEALDFNEFLDYWHLAEQKGEHKDLPSQHCSSTEPKLSSCGQCGTTVLSTDNYCSNCGVDLHQYS